MYTATFDNITECANLKSYGNFNYTGWDVESPHIVGPSIKSNSNPHYARASVAKRTSSGQLPTLTWNVPNGEVSVNSWWYACAKPGPGGISTQIPVNCNITLTTSNLFDSNTNSRNFVYVAPNTTSMAPMTQGDYWSAQGFLSSAKFNATDKNGNPVDLLIDVSLVLPQGVTYDL